MEEQETTFLDKLKDFFFGQQVRHPRVFLKISFCSWPGSSTQLLWIEYCIPDVTEGNHFRDSILPYVCGTVEARFVFFSWLDHTGGDAFFDPLIQARLSIPSLLPEEI